MEEEVALPPSDLAATVVCTAATASSFCYYFLIIVRHSRSESSLDVFVYSTAMFLAFLLFQFDFALNFENCYLYPIQIHPFCLLPWPPHVVVSLSKPLGMLLTLVDKG
ncbi:hypothetical protein HN873_060104 [Arachis hypogaea]